MGSASFEFKRQYGSEGEESFEDIIEQKLYGSDSSAIGPCVNQMQYGIDTATEIATILADELEEKYSKWQRLENKFFWKYFARFFFGY